MVILRTRTLKTMKVTSSTYRLNMYPKISGTKLTSLLTTTMSLSPLLQKAPLFSFSASASASPRLNDGTLFRFSNTPDEDKFVGVRSMSLCSYHLIKFLHTVTFTDTTTSYGSRTSR